MFSRVKEAVWGTAQRWFPDRQIYHRSDGQVRYFAISTGVQIGALMGATVLAGWLCFTTVSVAFHGRALAAKDAEIEQDRIYYHRMVAEAQANEATVISFMESRMEEFDRTAYEFQMRHETLRQLVNFAEQLTGREMSPSPALDDGRVLMAAAPADPSPREARDPLTAVATVASDAPEDQIAYLMGEQDAVLARAEDATEARLQNLRAVLRLTGLDIEDVIAENREGEERGGPFLPISETGTFGAPAGSGIELDDVFSARINRIAARLLEVEELENFANSGPLGVRSPTPIAGPAISACASTRSTAVRRPTAESISPPTAGPRSWQPVRAR